LRLAVASISHRKIALVTQVGNPILAAAAIMLATSGIQVIACDLEADHAQAVVDESRHLVPIVPFSGDLSSRDETDRLISSTLDRFGRIDTLLNGPVLPAGIVSPVVDTGLLDAGVAALRPWVNCVEAAAPVMSSGGRIVSVVTSAGQYRSGYFLPQNKALSAMPEALVNGSILGMTRQLALELAPRKVRVNAVVTGLMEGSEEFERMTAQERGYVLEEISLRRLGTPKEIASVIAFLVSQASNYVTGDAIDVNGGWWMS
jgi:3-oxoacyl-[acyl-carrier protein] reductase